MLSEKIRASFLDRCTNVENGHWKWVGSADDYGPVFETGSYGQAGARSGLMVRHRPAQIAFELRTGKPPRAPFVAGPTCAKNWCINPAHIGLLPGRHLMNSRSTSLTFNDAQSACDFEDVFILLRYAPAAQALLQAHFGLTSLVCHAARVVGLRSIEQTLDDLSLSQTATQTHKPATMPESLYLSLREIADEDGGIPRPLPIAPNNLDLLIAHAHRCDSLVLCRLRYELSQCRFNWRERLNTLTVDVNGSSVQISPGRQEFELYYAPHTRGFRFANRRR